MTRTVARDLLHCRRARCFQDGRHPEMQLTDVQPISDIGAHACQQRAVRPDFAGRGYTVDFTLLAKADSCR
jgi:hypothetical protein